MQHTPSPQQSPAPNLVLVSGILDEIHASHYLIYLLVKGERVRVHVPDADLIKAAGPHIGEQITVDGTAFYKPDRQLAFIDMQMFWPARPQDRTFEQVPTKETTRELVEKEIRHVKHFSSMEALEGAWPGDESLEELLEMLEK